MRKSTAITRFALALGIAATPARADNDNWGWHMWGWHMWGWRNGGGDGSGPGWMIGGGMMARMGAIDSNNDGEITEEEYMAVRMGSGARLNEVRQKAIQERKKEHFAAMDPDKDGKATPWEFRAMRWH